MSIRVNSIPIQPGPEAYRYSNNNSSKLPKSSTRFDELKRNLNNSEYAEQSLKPKDIISSIYKYSESVSTAREATEKTRNEVKKVNYSFKAMSAQIAKCKTANSARQMASKARREVVRLKRQSGSSDDEELQAAIAHARSMERIAKKKARHLEEEELVKIKEETGPTEDNEKLNSEAAVALEDEQELAEEAYEEEMKKAMEEALKQLEEELAEEMTEEMAEMLEELSAEMQEEMLEELKLSDFMEQMAAPPKEMTRTELEQYKNKHRNDEAKALIKADMEYMKAMFDLYSKGKGAQQPSAINGSGGVMPFSTPAMPSVAVQTPAVMEGASTPTMATPSIDISI